MAEQQTIYRDPEGRLCADTRFRVRYFETDRMGIVHHAAYITWFEEGRSAFSRALGYSYAQMETDGIGLAVVEVAARFLLPARYDDEVVVSTCLQELRSREVVFTYEVRSAAEGRLLVTGETRLLSVDAEGRVCRLPEAFLARAAAAPDESAEL